MKLHVKKSSYQLNRNELNRLNKSIKKIFIYQLNKNLYKLIPLQNYLELKYSKKINIKNILIQGINTAYFEEQMDEVVFKLNKNINLTEIPAKLIDICKLINYGNLEVKGFPIFTIVFTHISDNIDYYI